MARNSARFAYDSDTPQAVAAGSAVQFATSSAVGSAIQGNGSGGILLKAPGTYRVQAAFTLSATAAGAVTVQMSENLLPATAARAAATLAAAGDLATVEIIDQVTVRPGSAGSYATLTFAPDAAVGIRTASVLVERLCVC